MQVSIKECQLVFKSHEHYIYLTLQTTYPLNTSSNFHTLVNITQANQVRFIRSITNLINYLLKMQLFNSRN